MINPFPGAFELRHGMSLRLASSLQCLLNVEIFSKSACSYSAKWRLALKYPQLFEGHIDFHGPPSCPLALEIAAIGRAMPSRPATSRIIPGMLPA